MAIEKPYVLNVIAMEWMLDDLRKSGLSEETIDEMGCFPCPQGPEGTEILKKVLGFSSINGQPILQSSEVYFLPYPDDELDFCRAKIQTPLPSGNGKSPAKYLSKSRAAGGDDGKHPYMLKRDREKIGKAENIWITEGEKKTALLSQELAERDDHAAIGFPGVWMVPRIGKAYGKRFIIAYDSDFQRKREVQLSIASFCMKALEAKALPVLVSWPQEHGKGIDDYLLRKVDRAEELSRLFYEAEQNPFAMLSLITIEDIARHAAATKERRQVMEGWFETYNFKKLYATTKSAFLGLVKAERRAGVNPEGKLYEENGRTWRVVGSSDDSGEEIVELCSDFIFRIEKEIRDDAGRVSFECSATKEGKTFLFQAPGDALGDAATFRKLVASRLLCTYCVSSVSDHAEFVRFIEKKSKGTEKDEISQERETQFFGRIEGQPEFVFGNAKALPGAIEELKGIRLPKNLLRVEMPENLEDFWSDTISDFSECYGRETWKIFGFSAASVFADEIADRYGCFPLLFLNGGLGRGKSALAAKITAFFGAHRELKPFNFNSTAKARLRQAEKYRGVPLTFNEFQPGQKNNSLVQSLYDREGYQRAQTDNSLETLQSRINSTFILISTRNITGYESQAVVSRLVTVRFEVIQPNKPAFLKICEREPLLSSFVPLALKLDPKKLFREIDAGCIEIQRNSDCGERIAWTHELFRVFSCAFMGLLGKEGVAREEIRSSLNAAAGTVADQNPGMLFLRTLMSMHARQEFGDDSSSGIVRMVDEGDGERQLSVLYFSLPDAYPHVKAMCARFSDRNDLPDERTLGKLLEGLGAKRVGLTRKLGAQKRAWSILADSFQEEFSVAGDEAV